MNSVQQPIRKKQYTKILSNKLHGLKTKSKNSRNDMDIVFYTRVQGNYIFILNG